MNIFMYKPQPVQAATERKKGLVLPLEILCFIALFMVAETAIYIPYLISMIVYVVTNPAFVSSVQNGTVTATQVFVLIIDFSNSDLGLCVMLAVDALLILLTCLYCKVIQKRRMYSMGFVKKNFAKQYLAGLGIGFVVFSAAVLFCVITGGLTFNGGSGEGRRLLWLIPLFAGFMIQGMAEEVLCRGHLMVSVARRYPMWVGILVNSLAFAALHLLNDGVSVLAVINLTLFGVFASLYFLYTENIWGIAAIHTIWNFVQGNFYGIKVSGIEAGPSVFRFESTGSSLINGGDFGLEGGLGVTFAMVIGIAMLIFLSRRKSQKEQ